MAKPTVHPLAKFSDTVGKILLVFTGMTFFANGEIPFSSFVMLAMFALAGVISGVLALAASKGDPQATDIHKKAKFGWITCLLCFLFWSTVGPWDRSELGGDTRGKVARIKGDLRTMAIAIETYRVDYNIYPAWSSNRQANVFRTLEDPKNQLSSQPTFQLTPASGSFPLTTPVAYLSKEDNPSIDIFSPVKGATYSYWTNATSTTTATRYILWSAGPDRVYDLTLDRLTSIPRFAQPGPLDDSELASALAGWTYDPSNGARSPGDVWRCVH